MKMRWIVGLMVWAFIPTSIVWAQGSQAPLTLEESIKIGLERNLALHSAVEGVIGSEFRRKEAITNFLPWWTGQYGYTRWSYPAIVGNIGGGTTSFTGSPNVYSFNTAVDQPLFTGGLNLANYRSAKIGVDISKESVETVRRDIVLRVRVGYFIILRAEKFLTVPEQQVKQFEAQLEVTKAFFDVGIVPKNDVLQAEVQLANARQGLAAAENGLATA